MQGDACLTCRTWSCSSGSLGMNHHSMTMVLAVRTMCMGR